MVSIIACRERISDRFPLASFVVKVPPDRLFEIACATDPRLFAAENREHRTPANFATSRAAGLMRAPAGEATYFLPPEQLQRFAGARRLYYAVAAFRGPQGQDPIATVSRDRLDRVPSIQIAPDFTGKSLDRGKLQRAPAPPRYGGPGAEPIGWGGDVITAPPAAPTPRLGAPTARTGPAQATALEYDDGYDQGLWDEPRADDRADDRADELEQSGERYGGAREPAGFEDAPALAASAAEPDGIEDGAEAWRRFGAPLPPARTSAPTTAPPRAQAATRPAPPRPRFGDGAPHGRPGSDVAPGGPEGHEGYEDAPDLVRNLGPDRLRFGAPRARSAARAFGRFPNYAEDEPHEPPPAVRAMAMSDTPSFDPEDPRARLRILHRVAVAESGPDTYRAVNPDREYEDPELPDFYHRKHVGLSWGFIQFAQRYGSLGQVLAAANRRDPDAFRGAFGAHNGAPAGADPGTLPPGHLLAVTNARIEDDRLAPVAPPAGGPPVVLWDPAWVRAFQEAGNARAFQEAQREVADRRYYAPYLDFLAWLGLDSVRAHAMFVDRAIHMGGGAAMQWIASVVGPVQSQADLARCLERLGAPDLRAFQASPPAGATRWLAVDGAFGPRTHAAIAWALRQLGDPAVRLPGLEEMLVALCDDAARRATGNKSWSLAAERLRALKDDPALDHLPPEPAAR